MLKSRFENISPADHDSAAVLIREAGDQLLARLEVVALQPKRILDVGCGMGHCARLLQKRYPAAEIGGVDDSAAMLAYANALSPSSIQWLCASLDTLPAEDHSIDLVVGNLVLPWCMDLKKTLQEWRRVLRPEGLLIFSTYGPDTLRELQGQPIQLPPFVDMHDLGDLLVHANFAGPVLDVEHFTLTYREQQRLQDELQMMGFIAGQEMLQPMEKNSMGVVPLTYEVIYGHAWKPEASKNVLAEDGVVKFPLAHLRRQKDIFFGK